MFLSRPARFLPALALLAACSHAPPDILPIGDKSTTVNVPLEFDVAVKDDDSDKVTLTMKGAPKGATLTQIEGKLAKFQWIPNPAADPVQTITFVADDGDATDTETINVSVKEEGGGTFKLLSPDRYTYDVNTTSLVKFSLVVQADASDLDFEFAPDPQDWGAVIEPVGRQVRFSWEPTDEQKAVAQHQFLFTASDFDGNTLSKTISIIFRGQQTSTEECPNKVDPTVEVDDIPNQSGSELVLVTARVTDDRSAITQAVVFWTTVEEPQDGDWEHLVMDQNNDTEFATIIELAGMEPGQSQQITWHVCASDDDDAEGWQCDGWACSENRTFTVSGALGFCDPCEAGQCGSALCLRNGMGETFCGANCSRDQDCPEGFYCDDIDLAEGGTKKQCLPEGCLLSASDPACSCTAGRSTPPVEGDLVVNEVLFNPPETCPDGMATCTTAEKLVVDVNGDGVRRTYENEEEFVELVNPTDKYLDLVNVTLSDAGGVRFTFPAFVLPPGRAVLVFGGGDANAFASLGGAFRFSAGATSASSGLQLNNGTETVTLKLGATTIATASWTTNANGFSIVRATEGSAAAAFSNHTTAPGASGTKWSPGTHTCGLPFPLDAQACVPPSCSVVNRDDEPGSDTRASAPCLKPLPKTIESTLSANPTSGAEDARDIYVVEGRAGQRLVASTEGGAAPDIGDTYLRVYSRAGTLLAWNDDDPDRPTSYYSRLVFDLPADGFYYLEVTPFVYPNTPVSGSYKLTVQLTTP